MQESGSPVKHTALWTSVASFSWMSSAAVCEVAPRSWVCFVLVVGSRMWIFHYPGTVLVQEHCKMSWEGRGSGGCDTFSSLIPLLVGSPKWQSPLQFLLALPVCSAPWSHSCWGLWCLCEFWHLAGEDTAGGRRRDRHKSLPVFPSPAGIRWWWWC